ncbi:Predicted DNA-binding transcriptional regulator YafY, contains an HTH and WYL domains [Ensifer adhaerens]|nr:Predicted DNA-binding transcriptional regulator YafY, contains an HTH and WYL domains [Ensifer adhaerens]
MRASRLINILTTLQARGLVTATELSAENGVSLRTIYRDIDQLSLAGIPVYSERGPEGGYRLLDGYRVRLNGLSTKEAEALFLSGLPGPAADLGLGAVMASAEKKLAVALPEDLRKSAAAMRSRFHLDTVAWFGEGEQPTHLEAITDAVWNHKVVRMRYQTWRKEKTIETQPLGLVLKGGAWYLVARTKDAMLTYRIARILDLIVTDETFEPPRDFDLAAHWRESTDRLDAEMHPNVARVRLSKWGAQMLPYFNSGYANRRMEMSEPGPDGWREATLPIGSTRQAATEFLRLGPEVEVLEPQDLRDMMAEMAAKMVAIYSPVHSG